LDQSNSCFSEQISSLFPKKFLPGYCFLEKNQTYSGWRVSGNSHAGLDQQAILELQKMFNWRFSGLHKLGPVPVVPLKKIIFRTAVKNLAHDCFTKS